MTTHDLHADDFADDYADEHCYDGPQADADPIDLTDGEAQALLEASTHLRRIAWWQRRRNVAAAVWDSELQRIAIARVDDLERIDRHIAWHAQPVEQLMESLHAADPGRKTINLPGGQMVARLGQPSFSVIDEEAFTAWNDLHALPFVRRKPVPALDQIRKGLQVGPASPDHDALSVVDPSTGEIVPGIVAYPARTTYTAKPDLTAGDL